MKLFIDDIRTPPDDSWNICRDVSSAIRALDMFYESVTEINLDHDISHQISMTGTKGMSRPYPCSETFEAVARYIALIRKAELNYRASDNAWNPKIQIHTSNHVGAKNMFDILHRAGFTNIDAKVVGGANRLETIL